MPALCNTTNYSMISVQKVPHFWHFLQNLLLQLHLAHFLLVDLFLHLGSCRLKLLHFVFLFLHFFGFFVGLGEVVLGVVGIGVGAGVGGVVVVGVGILQSRTFGTEKKYLFKYRLKKVKLSSAFMKIFNLMYQIQMMDLSFEKRKSQILT